jgi:glyoxylase-like metal-dependent hydrolase (beta-lactamase superfamily II)
VHPFNSYIITSPNGESVVVDPADMPSRDIVNINPSVIVNTHGHPDHEDATF